MTLLLQLQATELKILYKKFIHIFPTETADMAVRAIHSPSLAASSAVCSSVTVTVTVTLNNLEY